MLPNDFTSFANAFVWGFFILGMFAIFINFYFPFYNVKGKDDKDK